MEGLEGNLALFHQVVSNPGQFESRQRVLKTIAKQFSVDNSQVPDGLMDNQGTIPDAIWNNLGKYTKTRVVTFLAAVECINCPESQLSSVLNDALNREREGSTQSLQTLGGIAEFIQEAFLDDPDEDSPESPEDEDEDGIPEDEEEEDPEEVA